MPRGPKGGKFPMPSGSYVVHFLGCEDRMPFKHFDKHSDAVSHAQSRVQSGGAEQANVYMVADVDNAGVAIAAVKKGKAQYVQTCTRHASEVEIAEQLRGVAQKGGLLALLRYVRLIKAPAPSIEVKRRKVP